ncbi:MAG: hypothetical protein K8L99_12705 [Anaerolineae bacterium]|nr:hypothetical protein [Anaerolineae bacterium]
MAAIVTRLILLLLGGLAPLVGIIHVLPYDYSSIELVRTLFIGHEDCPALCFMGLYTGMDTQTALDKLNHHAWVRAVYITESAGDNQTINWRWNGQQPPFFNGLRSGTSAAQGNMITSISLPTTLTMGDIWLIFGAPERGAIDSVYHFAEYTAQGFSIRARASCTHFWTARSDVFISTRQYQLPPGSEYYDMAHVRRTICDRLR